MLHPALNKLYDCEILPRFEHETFIIRYKPELQGHLDLHHDHSTFTFCVTFSSEEDYEGGGTYFHLQDKMIPAKRGDVCIFPCNYLWPHEGTIPISDPKYAITSFISYASNG